MLDESYAKPYADVLEAGPPNFLHATSCRWHPWVLTSNYFPRWIRGHWVCGPEHLEIHRAIGRPAQERSA